MPGCLHFLPLIIYIYQTTETPKNNKHQQTPRTKIDNKMSKYVYIQFEIASGDDWIEEGLEQIAKRKQKGKKSRTGVKAKDRSLVKKLNAKKGCKKVEMVRLHCYSHYESIIMATQAVYRSHNDDGTVREITGDKHFFNTGEFAFKKASGEYSKISLQRDGSVIKASNQAGNTVRVCHSMKVQVLRC